MSKNSLLAIKKKKAIQLFNENRLDEAEKYLKQVIQKARMDAESWYLLGMINAYRANHAGAEHCFQQVVRIDPSVMDAYINLGAALAAQGKHQPAVDTLASVIDTRPDDIDALLNISTSLLSLNRPEQAVGHAEHARTIAPDLAAANSNLAIVYTALGRLDEATDLYEQALNKAPGNTGILSNFARMLLQKRDYDHCKKICYELLKYEPGNHNVFNILLTAYEDTGEIKKSLQLYRNKLESDPELILKYAGYLFVLNYDEDITPEYLYQEHSRWGGKIEQLSRKNTQYKTQPDTGKKLRIGYVSPDFRNHSVAFFIEPVLENHDPDRFEVYCYSNVQHEDDVTRRLKTCNVHWRDIHDLNDEAVDSLVREDEIDILVDLAGYTTNTRLLLFTRKPAPVQVSYLGYPATTGLTCIDYRLVDNQTDPEAYDQFSTEQLVRMPDIFLSYKNTNELPTQRAQDNDHVVFASFNNLSKINKQVIQAWSAILEQTPGSTLLLKNKVFQDPGIAEIYVNMFSAQGIDPGRLEMMGYIKDDLEHLALYLQVDISLDTFPYNGTTTTCESLWMGVPVITFAGDRHAARVSHSILQAVGVPELIANDQAGYIGLAVSLANDTKRRQHYRDNIRQMMLASPLSDHAGFAGKLETIYHTMWQQWCAQNSQ
jgi:predicted O-linked N-acetylglucosamine transferase (SPINDLY family)